MQFKAEWNVIHRIDAAVGVDMKRVVVFAGVAEESVIRVEHLLREEVEPLAGHSAVVEPLFAAEFDHEPLAEVLRPQLHDAPVRFLRDINTSHQNAAGYVSVWQLRWRHQLANQGSAVWARKQFSPRDEASRAARRRRAKPDGCRARAKRPPQRNDTNWNEWRISGAQLYQRHQPHKWITLSRWETTASEWRMNENAIDYASAYDATNEYLNTIARFNPVFFLWLSSGGWDAEAEFNQNQFFKFVNKPRKSQRGKLQADSGPTAAAWSEAPSGGSSSWPPDHACSAAALPRGSHRGGTPHTRRWLRSLR